MKLPTAAKTASSVSFFNPQEVYEADFCSLLDEREPEQR